MIPHNHNLINSLNHVFTQDSETCVLISLIIREHKSTI